MVKDKDEIKTVTAPPAPPVSSTRDVPVASDAPTVLVDPSVKTFAQVRAEREASGEAAAISHEAYPDPNRKEGKPSPRAQKEMARGADAVKAVA